MTSLEHGGLISDGGKLGRSSDYWPWFLPGKVELSDDQLLWWYPDTRENRPWLRAKAGPELLGQFVALGAASPKQIRDFASKWGVFQICNHYLPSGHPLGQGSSKYDYPPTLECRPIGWPREPYHEPLEIWRHFSRSMAAVLNLAAMIHQEKTGSDEDWRTIYEWAKDTDGTPIQAPWWTRKRDPSTGEVTPDSLDAEKAHLGMIINEFISIGGIRPSFWWPEEKPQLRLLEGSLFGALALQLALAVSHSDGLHNCSICHRTYVPSRRPRTEENHYCLECRIRKIPQRLASERYRGNRKKKGVRSRRQRKT